MPANFLLSLYGMGSALMVYSLVCGDIAGELKNPHKLLIFFGTASYSIYLVHFLALSVFIKVFLKLGLNNLMPLTANYIALVMIVVVAGSLFHIYVEKPLLRWLRNKLLPTR